MTTVIRFTGFLCIALALGLARPSATAAGKTIKGDRRHLQGNVATDSSTLMYGYQESTSKSSKSKSSSSSSSDKDCGDKGERCCPWNRCNVPGLGCRTYDPMKDQFVKYPTCERCGSIGQPCCPSTCHKDGDDGTCSGTCAGDSVCSFENVCVTCGGLQDDGRTPAPCCEDDQGRPYCDEGRTCMGGRCEECGVNGGPCCVCPITGEKTCPFSRVCINNQCFNCGGEDNQGRSQVCCEDGQGKPYCEDGRTCIGGRCEVCGTLDEKCCAGRKGERFCTQDNRTCQGGRCVSCGTEDSVCCDNGGPKCRMPGFVCDEGNRCVNATT